MKEHLRPTILKGESMYRNLSGRDLDQWAEARGIKRYQGFIFPDSDEKFKEEISKNLPISQNNGFITITFYDVQISCKLVLVDKSDDFLFEINDSHVDSNGKLIKSLPVSIFPFSYLSDEFQSIFPELCNSWFFWVIHHYSFYFGDQELLNQFRQTARCTVSYPLASRS